MKPPTIAFLDVAIICAIIGAPGLSVTAANVTVETGLLTRVGGNHMLTLPFAHDLGITVANLAVWVGLLMVLDSIMVALSTVGSPKTVDR